MTRRQRRVLQALGALIAVVAVALGIVQVQPREGDGGPATGTEARSAAATSTTLALIAVEGSTSTSTPVATTTTVPAVPATTTTALRPVSAAGAVMTRPVTIPRTLDPVRGCASLADPGWTTVRCERVAARGSELIWLLESRPASQYRVLVLRPATAGAWSVVLASPEDGARWSRIGVRSVDLSGDAAPEIAIGFHSKSGSGGLALDVVEGPGRVVIHEELGQGSVALQTGRLDVWAVVQGSAVHSRIHHDGSAWRRASMEPVDARSVPPSDL